MLATVIPISTVYVCTRCGVRREESLQGSNQRTCWNSTKTLPACRKILGSVFVLHSVLQSNIIPPLAHFPYAIPYSLPTPSLLHSPSHLSTSHRSIPTPAPTWAHSDLPPGRCEPAPTTPLIGSGYVFRSSCAVELFPLASRLHRNCLGGYTL